MTTNERRSRARTSKTFVVVLSHAFVILLGETCNLLTSRTTSENDMKRKS